jgi:hypothetical protein
MLAAVAVSTLLGAVPVPVVAMASLLLAFMVRTPEDKKRPTPISPPPRASPLRARKSCCCFFRFSSSTSRATITASERWKAKSHSCMVCMLAAENTQVRSGVVI